MYLYQDSELSKIIEECDIYVHMMKEILNHGERNYLTVGLTGYLA